MANTQAVSGALKQAALSAVVDSKTLKAALYLVSATTNGTNSVYTTHGRSFGHELHRRWRISYQRKYRGPDEHHAFWTPSASITYTTVTLATAFDAVMIYSTTDTNRNLGVFTFGSQTVTAGTLTLTMPTNDSTSGLIRLRVS
jgi:hypothetical protein